MAVLIRAATLCHLFFLLSISYSYHHKNAKNRSQSNSHNNNSNTTKLDLNTHDDQLSSTVTSHLANISLSQDIAPAILKKATKVCVFHHNWRTASLFELNVLKFRGNSSFSFIVNEAKGCGPGSKSVGYNVELVSMMGKTITFDYEYSASLQAAYISRPARRIITGDEECMCRFSDCGIYPNPRGVIAREYFTDRFMHQWEFGSSFGSRHNSVAYIPLGPRMDFGFVPWTGKPTQRLWLFNLIVSPTTSSRRKLVAFVNSTGFAKSVGQAVPFVLNIAKTWHGDFGANTADTVNSSVYKYVLHHSVFTLCPSGTCFLNTITLRSNCHSSPRRLRKQPRLLSHLRGHRSGFHPYFES